MAHGDGWVCSSMLVAMRSRARGHMFSSVSDLFFRVPHLRPTAYEHRVSAYGVGESGEEVAETRVKY